MINDHAVKDKDLMQMIKERYSSEAIYPKRNGFVSPITDDFVSLDEVEVDDDEDELLIEDAITGEEEVIYDGQVREDTFDQDLVDINESNSNQKDEFSQSDSKYEEMPICDAEIQSN